MRFLLGQCGFHKLLSVFVEVSLAECQDTEDQARKADRHACVGIAVVDFSVRVQQKEHGCGWSRHVNLIRAMRHGQQAGAHNQRRPKQFVD